MTTTGFIFAQSRVLIFFAMLVSTYCYELAWRFQTALHEGNSSQNEVSSFSNTVAMFSNYI